MPISLPEGAVVLQVLRVCLVTTVNWLLYASHWLAAIRSAQDWLSCGGEERRGLQGHISTFNIS